VNNADEIAFLKNTRILNYARPGNINLL